MVAMGPLFGNQIVQQSEKNILYAFNVPDQLLPRPTSPSRKTQLHFFSPRDLIGSVLHEVCKRLGKGRFSPQKEG